MMDDREQKGKDFESDLFPKVLDKMNTFEPLPLPPPLLEKKRLDGKTIETSTRLWNWDRLKLLRGIER